jgi:hypothetical protein
LAHWLWVTVKLTLGLSQMAGAVITLFLYIKEGPTPTVMKLFISGTSLTTLSILLFKVLRWKPIDRGRDER